MEFNTYYNREEIHVAFSCLLSQPPREADIAAIQLLGSTPDAVAEYVWDHWMGEPDKPTVEELEACLVSNDWLIRHPAVSIGMASQADIDKIDANASVGESAVVRFYGKVVAISDEYGTVTALEGLDKDRLEAFVWAALVVWPTKYNSVDPVCYRCNYRKTNHNHDEACDEFQDTPEHLRF